MMASDARTLSRTFHARDPYWQARIPNDLPSAICRIGTMRRVGYRSDKWEVRGDRYRYTHDHGPGVGIYVAGDGEACERAPRWPEQWACLGTVWQCEYEEDGTGALMEPVIPRGSWLLASPSGRLLIVSHKTRGFVCAIFGGDMHVTADGIVG